MLAYSDVAPEGPLMYAARPPIPMAATMLSETTALSAPHFTGRRRPNTQEAKLLVVRFREDFTGHLTFRVWPTTADPHGGQRPAVAHRLAATTVPPLSGVEALERCIVSGA
jgi:hypothetical protein